MIAWALSRRWRRLRGVPQFFQAEGPWSGVDMPRQVILLIDDDPNIEATICDMLRHSGYNVILAPRGATAQEIAATPFDILVTDLVMPEVDGWEIIETVRRERPTTPIVAFSGKGVLFPDRISDLAVKASGADCLLGKPLRRALLEETIESLWRKYHAARN